MAKLFITCWRHHLAVEFNRTVDVPMTPPLSEMYLYITDDMAVSNEFPDKTTFITLKAEADCAVAFGTKPKADPDHHVLEKGERVMYGALPGDKVAVVGVSPHREYMRLSQWSSELDLKEKDLLAKGAELVGFAEQLAIHKKMIEEMEKEWTIHREPGPFKTPNEPSGFEEEEH